MASTSSSAANVDGIPSTSELEGLMPGHTQPTLNGVKLAVYYPLPEPELVCPYPKCWKVFTTWMDDNNNRSNVSRLVTHLKREHKISEIAKTNACLKCKKDIGAISRGQLHGCLDKIPIRDPSIYTHVCETCGKRFHSSKSLAWHTKVHKKKRVVKPILFNTPVKKAKKEVVGQCSFSVGDMMVTLPESDDEDGDEDPMWLNDVSHEQPEEEIDFVQDEVKEQALDEQLATLVRKWKMELFEYLHWRSRNEKNWKAFEKKLAEIIQKIQIALNIRTGWLDHQQYIDEQETLTQNELRKLYARNPKRAVNILKGTKPQVCNIQPADVQEFFTVKMAEAEAIDEDYFGKIPDSELTVKMAEVEAIDKDCNDKVPEADVIHRAKLRVIRAEEVIARLKKFKNTAAGPDKLQYRHWLEVDDSGQLLCIIYNICLKFQRIPQAWKESKTFLFAKNKTPESINEYRPISLLCTIYKTYSALLSDRLREWCLMNNIIDMSQKGGTSHDVILDHGFLIDYLIRSAKRRQQHLYLAFLDIKEAFPSTPTSAVLSALKASGAGDRIGNIVKDLLFKRTTEIITGQGTTQSIAVNRGILMGDPISNVLFSIVLNYAIKKVNATEPCEEYIPYSILADVDDLAVFASTEAQLQEKVTIIEDSLKQIHMDLSPSKCVALHIDAKDNYSAAEITIMVNKERIRYLTGDETHKYIGIDIGYSRTPPKTPLDMFKYDADCIFTSDLGGFQKIDALKTYLMPTWYHELKMGWSKRKDWKLFDNYMRALMKIALGVKTNAPEGYIYGPRKKACMGLTKCRDDFDLMKIVNAFKLLTNADPVIQKVASVDVQRHIYQIEGDVAPQTDQQPTMDYLTDVEGHGVGKNESVWSQARISSKAIDITWNCNAKGDVSLDVEKIPMDIKDAKTIMKDLRDQRKDYYYKDLIDPLKHPCMGQSMHVFRGFSNHILGECRSNQDYEFLHHARLNMSPVKASPVSKHYGNDPKCRKCKDPDPENCESLTHVLNCCKCNKTVMTDRHNAIQDMLKQVLIKNQFRIVTVDQALPSSTSSRRPDMLVTKGFQAYLIDITIAMDMDADKLDVAAQRKIKRYASLAKEYERNNTDFHAKVVPFVVGSRGAWYPPNDAFLRMVMKDKKKRIAFSKQCCSTVIRWSRCIYDAHVRKWNIRMENGYPTTVPSTTEVTPAPMSVDSANDDQKKKQKRSSKQRKKTSTPAVTSPRVNVVAPAVFAGSSKANAAVLQPESSTPMEVSPSSPDSIPPTKPEQKPKPTRTSNRRKKQ